METIHLTIGARHTIQLPGLGTAGYAWFASIEDTTVVSVSSAGTAPRAATDAGAPGFSASRDELFEVVALKPGGTVVHLKQTRPWEHDKAPRASREYMIEVSAA